MQSTTLLISVIACVLILVSRPIYALAIYIGVLLLYPSYLVITLGTIDISVGRFAVGVLLLRCFLDTKIRSQFLWSGMDTLVTLSMLVYVTVFSIALPLPVALESQSGFLMDTWFAYMVARFIITDQSKLVTFTKVIGIVLIPLAIIGVYESITGCQIFFLLRRFCPWIGAIHESYEPRFGFYRAVGPFNHPILFGGVFAIFLPFLYYLRYQRDSWHTLGYVFTVVALIGAMSSVSAGSWVMVIIILLALAMEQQKHWVKPLLLAFVALCVLIGVASNRPFYHVLVSYLNPLGGTGWHRAKLLDVAIMHINEWWLSGYGDQDPGWGHYLGMGRTDITNQFILAGVKYGIWGVIALCSVLVATFRGLSRAYKRSINPEMKSLYWFLGALMFSVAVTWFSVTFFGQLESIFYFVLGIIASSISLSFQRLSDRCCVMPAVNATIAQ